MRILLTGGSGFVGKNFVKKFSNKYEILYPSHKELDLLDTMAVDSYFKKNKIDVVVHCATVGGVRGRKVKNNIVEENLRMFFNIVKNRDKFGKMIHLGSGAEYDKSRNIVKIKESDFGIKIPNDDYGFYKYVCSKYIENSKNVYCLRPFGIFGKYEDYSVRFISNLICKYIKKMPLTMIRDCYFSYIYIDDFLNIIEYFILNNPKEKFFNIGNNKKNSLLSITKEINNLDDYSLPIIIKNSGLNKEYTSNCDRLKSEIPSLKFTPFDIAIKELYGYYLSNKARIKKNILTKNE